MGLSDSRPRPPRGYVFPQGVVAGATPRRASQVPRPICQHAPPPLTPESSPGAHARCFTDDTGLHHSWKDGHSHQFNEAESGSLTLRLALSPPSRLRQVGLPRPALDGLHVKRAIYMANTFQFARLTRLGLAHQDIQDERDFKIKNMSLSTILFPSFCFEKDFFDRIYRTST